jgi:L-arabinose isomerase
MPTRYAPRIGVFGNGLAAYWPQFPGLQHRLAGYLGHVERQLAALGADIRTAGLVDTPFAAVAAGDHFAREQVDLVVCYVATYATSSQVLPTVQRARRPVLVLNLQPCARLDYATVDTAEWLANCCACCVPEISNAFARARIAFQVVSGQLFDDPAAWQAIGDWVRAAAVARGLANARIGFLGHTYPGMLDLSSDVTGIHGQLGTHVEVLEMEDLASRVARVDDAALAAQLAVIHDTFAVAAPGSDRIAREVSPAALAEAARVAGGLHQLVHDFQLDGLAYYYRGLDGNAFEQLSAGMIVGNSLLTAAGVPCSGEGDLKTCLAMLILDRLGAGGSFTEFNALDFVDGFLLMGHDGPGHVAISDQRPTLRGLGLFHGKRGGGLSVEFAVRHGPVTILGMTQTETGRLRLLLAEGEVIAGPTMQIGNTNSRVRFAQPPAAFMDAWCAHGPTHHVALGVGHQRGAIERVARLLGLECVVV